MKHSTRLSPLTIAALVLSCGSRALGAATQEEFFQSMQHNVDNASDGSGLVLWMLAGVVGLVILVYVVGSRQKPTVTKVKVLNNSRKLMREIAKSAQLKSWEVKELKTAADDGVCENPLTLILCPSLLVKAVNEPVPTAKVNRRRGRRSRGRSPRQNQRFSKSHQVKRPDHRSPLKHPINKRKKAVALCDCLSSFL